MSGTYLQPKRRRWLWPLAGLAVLLAMGMVALVLIYPRLGASMVRSKAVDKLGVKLGRDVHVGKVDVWFGHAVLHDIAVRGELDGDTPLVQIDRVEVAFDGWSSLLGHVELGAVVIDGVTVTLRRGADGRDNLRDVLDRLRAPGAGSGDDGAAAKLRPTMIDVRHVRLLANDDQTGTTALVSDGEARWTPGELAAQLRNVTATTIGAPKAVAAVVNIRKQSGAAPVVAIEGGELALWPTMALSGITGSVVADPARAGQYVIEVAGSWGGVPGRLWTAKGALDPVALTATVDLEAAKFQLDRLAPILEHSAVVDYASTSVDTKVHIAADRAGARFAGSFHLSGLNVGHPMMADKEVHDLDLSGTVAGSFDRATRTVELTQGDFVTRDVPFSITGVVAAPHRVVPEAVATPVVPLDPAAPVVPLSGPHGLQVVKLHLVIPTIACQRVLDAIPKEMAPYMGGYRLKGVFDADVALAIDWANLDATALDGHVGIRGCHVVDEPGDSPRRLLEEFQHYVEVDKGEWISFQVGPSNPDFVKFDEISPYLVKSIMSTEDSAFYYHHGFITSEFHTALVNDLKANGFKFGASSITMQMVKNVLLYREKTLARKLQELFLTWHVENTLSKDRILEIYFNVIEFGPGLYGIGPAAQHYFGKPAKDLNPVEAAFFSTILPAPKERYKQYCAGTLTKWTQSKIERILAIELKRDRLTQVEYDEAIKTPLVFIKPEGDGAETEDECMKRVKKAIKNARSTSPFAAGAGPEGPIAEPPAKKPSRHDGDEKKDGDEKPKHRRHRKPDKSEKSEKSDKSDKTDSDAKPQAPSP